MRSKQQEMDSIVSQVYTAIEHEEHLQSTLFVLCGDHGMNEAGNHGGSSAGETSAALLFLSPKFQKRGERQESPVEPVDELEYYRKIGQSDITPTLAGLLGLPISLNNLGVFIPELLVMWEHGRITLCPSFYCLADSMVESERIDILLENAKQILGTMKATFPSYSFDPTPIRPQCESEASTDIEKAQCIWNQIHELLYRSNDREEVNSQLQELLLKFLRISQSIMSSTAANYDLNKLFLGLFVGGIAVFLAFLPTYKLLVKSKYPGLFFIFSILGYGGMMFASSYVEEEQQFWYWVFTGWTFYLHVKSAKQQRNRVHGSSYRSRIPWLSSIYTIGLAVTYRILRRWNQTGQKFAAEPDIARTFFPSNQNIFWVLVIFTYADMAKSLVGSPGSLLWRLVGCLTTLAAFIFKAAFVASDSPELLGDSFLEPFGETLSSVSLVMQARTVFCGVAIMFLLAALAKNDSRKSAKHNSKPSHVPTFPDTLLIKQLQRRKLCFMKRSRFS